MSNVIGNLRVILGLDSAAFQRGMQNATRSLNKVGQDMQRIGRRASVSLTAPLVGFAGLAIKTAADFQSSMNQVAAVSGATGSDLAALTAQARELGETTQFSASQAADAMNFLAMAGYDTQQILGAMPDTLKLASAAQLDMADAADIVTNILAGYSMEVEDLAHANDVLVKAFTSANTDLTQLGEAMKYAGPVASAAGVEFEEAAAALAMMGNAGIQGSMAGTSLRGAIARILSPTKSMRDAMEAAGLSGDELAEAMEGADGASENLAETMAGAGLDFTDAAGRLLPIADILEQLERHADDAGLMMELFGQRAGPAMAALVSQGADSVRDLTDELRNSGGTAERISAVQMQGFNGAMKELQSAFQELQIVIANSGLLDFVQKMVRGLTDFIKRLNETSPETLRWATILGALAAAIGPVLIGLGLMLTSLGPITAAFAALASPIGAVVLAIGALAGVGVYLYRNWDRLLEQFPLLAAGADMLSAAWDRVKGVGAQLRAEIKMVGEFLEPVLPLFRGISGFIAGNMTARFKAIAALLRGDVSGAVTIMTDRFREIADDIMPHLQAFAEAAREYFAGLAAEAIEWARGIVQGIIDGLLGLYEAGREAVSNLGQGLRDSVTGLIDDARQWGSDIAAGLTGGIARGAGNVKDAVNNMASGVRDWFTGPLEIQSPSQVFMRFGQWITEGLALGIDQGSEQPIASMEGLSDKTLSVMDSFKSGFQDVVSSVLDGTKTLPQAIGDMLKSIASQLMNSGINNLFGSLFGGSGSAAGGGLFSGLFGGGIPSREGGGYTWDGPRTGGLDGRGGQLALLHPNETVIDHTKGGGAPGAVDVRVYVDQGGNWQAEVARISGRVSAQVVGDVSRRQADVRYLKGGS